MDNKPLMVILGQKKKDIPSLASACLQCWTGHAHICIYLWYQTTVHANARSVQLPLPAPPQ